MKGVEFRRRSEVCHDVYLDGRRFAAFCYTRKGDVRSWSIEICPQWLPSEGAVLTLEDWRAIGDTFNELSNEY